MIGSMRPFAHAAAGAFAFEPGAIVGGATGAFAFEPGAIVGGAADALGACAPAEFAIGGLGCFARDGGVTIVASRLPGGGAAPFASRGVGGVDAAFASPGVGAPFASRGVGAGAERAFASAPSGSSGIGSRSSMIALSAL